MTDTTELAQSLKAAAVRAKTATEEYASGHMSVSVCYAECEEFNRLTDGPDNILALVEALEKAQQEAVEFSKFKEVMTSATEALKVGNSPVIPDGYVMVPKEPTSEMLRAHVGMKPKVWDVQLRKTWAAMLAAAPHDTPALNSLQSVDSVTGRWIPVSERMPDPKSDQRVCAYTPTPHEDIRYRFVPASLFKAVCTDATHWHYMEPPAAPQGMK